MPTYLSPPGDVLGAYIRDIRRRLQLLETGARGIGQYTSRVDFLAHLSDLDPHPQYLTDTDAAATYAALISGAWTSFSLTLAGSSGITIGNAVQDNAVRIRDDKTVEVRIELVLGSSSSVTGTVSLGPLPFSVLGGSQIGSAWWYRNSTTMRAGISSFSGTTVQRIVLAADGYYNNTTGGASATGDVIRVAAGALELA